MTERDRAQHAAFMARAIELSETAWKSGKGLPIGCVIVRNGEIIGEGHNEIFVRNNPTAHGEMVAIEQACKNTGELQLKDADLYTTLEPCPMCFGAIYWAGIKTVYYANTCKDAAEAGFDDSFIFREINKAPDQRAIPFCHVQHAKAMEVLREWKAKALPASQPWADKQE